jgi:hypothetical protein
LGKEVVTAASFAAANEVTAGRTGRGEQRMRKTGATRKQRRNRREVELQACRRKVIVVKEVDEVYVYFRVGLSVVAGPRALRALAQCVMKRYVLEKVGQGQKQLILRPQRGLGVRSVRGWKGRLEWYEDFGLAGKRAGRGL